MNERIVLRTRTEFDRHAFTSYIPDDYMVRQVLKEVRKTVKAEDHKPYKRTLQIFYYALRNHLYSLLRAGSDGLVFTTEERNYLIVLIEKIVPYLTTAKRPMEIICTSTHYFPPLV